MTAEADPQTKVLQPYVPSEAKPREWTLRAVLLGLFMSVIFNAANAYVGLRVGLTVSASIPSAVVSMVLLRRWLPALQRKLGFRHAAPGTILENNLVHTIASSGESLAAGVIFTLPAFYFLTTKGAQKGQLLSSWETFFFAVAGGVIGVVAMVPLRRRLTIEEHAVLPFPESQACAAVLIAGDERGADARPVLWGAMAGGLGKMLAGGVGLWPETVTYTWTRLHKLTMGFESSPLLVGMGYLIGIRVAGVMLAGAVLGHVCLIPLIDWAAAGGMSVLAPATAPVAELTGLGIRQAYIKYIGAGGVALGGLLSVVRLLPRVLGRLGVGSQRRVPGQSMVRTDQDIPLRLRWVLWFLGVLIVAGLLWKYAGAWGILPWLLLVGFTLVCTVFFVAVASRSVAIVGSTSQPVSGMTLTVVLISGLVVASLGYSGVPAELAAMVVGGITCIAICLSGDLSQDLKVGALLGATPKYVQYGELIGTAFAALRAGAILALLHAAYGLGSQKLQAPQAELMANLVRGATGGSLVWPLLGFGAAIGLAVELCGVSALAFSIGLYLPVSTWPPIFLGGMVAWIGTRARGKKGSVQTSHGDPGVLFASGMVAGDALVGIVLSLLTVLVASDASHLSVPLYQPMHLWGTSAWTVSLASLLTVCGLMWWVGFKLTRGGL